MKDRLSQEDLQKIKHWAHKQNKKTGDCPMCGSKCLLTPENKSTQFL